MWVQGVAKTGTGICIKQVRKATPEEIEASKSVIVGGYKAEFINGVKFGCQTINKHTIKQLLELSKVTKITIAGEDITTDLLTKILDRI